MIQGGELGELCWCGELCWRGEVLGCGLGWAAGEVLGVGVARALGLGEPPWPPGHPGPVPCWPPCWRPSWPSGRCVPRWLCCGLDGNGLCVAAVCRYGCDGVAAGLLVTLG